MPHFETFFYKKVGAEKGKIAEHAKIITTVEIWVRTLIIFHPFVVSGNGKMTNTYKMNHTLFKPT